MPRPRKYHEELLDRGIGLVFEPRRSIAQVARDLGIHPLALRKRVRQAEADSGRGSDLLTSQEREEIRKLRARTRSCAARTDPPLCLGVFARELDPTSAVRGQARRLVGA